MLLVEVEVHAEGLKVGEQGHQVLEAPAKPVDRPRRDHVELPAGRGLHHRVEPRALIAALGPADAVGEGGDNLPSAALRNRLELALLVLDALIPVTCTRNTSFAYPLADLHGGKHEAAIAHERDNHLFLGMAGPGWIDLIRLLLECFEIPVIDFADDINKHSALAIRFMDRDSR